MKVTKMQTKSALFLGRPIFMFELSNAPIWKGYESHIITRSEVQKILRRLQSWKKFFGNSRSIAENLNASMVAKEVYHCIRQGMA